MALPLLGCVNVTTLMEMDSIIDLGDVTCLASALSDPTIAGHEDQESPSVGEAYFYLVAYNDGWGSTYGTESATKPSVAKSGACE